MSLLRICRLVCAAALILSPGGLFAQEHSFTPADIENGGRLYQGSCVGCHGQTGDALPGVNLFRGPFRRATSDTEIIGIIRNGIPGTAMPPHNFTETQTGTIVAYLRSMAGGPARSTAADALRGDAARGRAIFEGKGACMTCHRVNGAGKRTAPDLSDVGTLRQPPELERSLLDPNADLRAGNRFYQAVAKDGTTITGRLLNQDSFTIQLLDTREQLVSLTKSNLKEHGFVKTSPMPSYRDKLTAQEIADVVSYLDSLKRTVAR